MTPSFVAPPSARPQLFQRHWTWWRLVLSSNNIVYAWGPDMVKRYGKAHGTAE
jgi:hypothetical protein